MTKTKKSKRIFIHIPKTGGTSINCDMHGTEWQTQPGFNYRHIIYQTKCSNSADIFDPKSNEKYVGFEVFMMLRDPIDRLFSEYYFLRDRPEFFSLLSKKPNNFYEYCMLSNTQNGMIKFLLGKKIYSNMPVFEKHFQQIESSIYDLDIKVGVFERYKESLSYFSQCFDFDWSRTMNKKRMTLSKPDMHGLSNEQIEKIRILNSYDYKLYYNACELLSKQQITEVDLDFTGSKYDYVLKYTERFVLIEGVLRNKLIISRNKSFFKRLDLEVRGVSATGLEYVNNWNEKLESVLIANVKDSNVLNELVSIEKTTGLDKSYQLAGVIDMFALYFNTLTLI
ncbi:MAG: hypothetical protein ACI9N1_000809 [Flavobacteriales bacterium]|jgi:hypothetical protein